MKHEFVNALAVAGIIALGLGAMVYLKADAKDIAIAAVGALAGFIGGAAAVKASQ